ncbi:MAG TPA: (d)CMP kinase [Vicinamibacterales bacterium]|nr:(d)CMP kinase [Vicinamibacterales bacterium]
MTANAARRLLIAIDGPSGAGKGTVARAVAARLSYRHVDTGAMYRALAWKAVCERVDLDDEEALAALAARITIEVGDGVVRVDGGDVRQAIRTPEIDRAAAAVARQPGVRQVLIAQQREMGARGGVVMEGRDIGTVVFPGAEVKVYLDASPEERARRRATDAGHASGKGTAGVTEVASALAERDRSDTTRAASPLALAADAVRIDTTGVPIDEVVDRIMALVQQRDQR